MLSLLGGALGLVSGRRVVGVALGVGRPQGQVVPEQLHDEGRVLVAVLAQVVKLGDRVVEGLKVGKDKRCELVYTDVSITVGMGFVR